jgi:hypothetical protein
MPLATAGVDPAWPSVETVAVHSGLQTWPPEAQSVLKAFNFPSADSMYAIPLKTESDQKETSVLATHSGEQGWPFELQVVDNT